MMFPRGDWRAWKFFKRDHAGVSPRSCHRHEGARPGVDRAAQISTDSMSLAPIPRTGRSALSVFPPAPSAPRLLWRAARRVARHLETGADLRVALHLETAADPLVALALLSGVVDCPSAVERQSLVPDHECPRAAARPADPHTDDGLPLEPLAARDGWPPGSDKPRCRGSRGSCDCRGFQENDPHGIAMAA